VRVLSVYCLCAEWCTTCKAFRPVLDAVAAAHPEAELHWIDVEDESERVDPVEVETFPTLLVVRDGEPLHFAAIRPQREPLERLLEAAPASAVPAAAQRSLQALAARLAAR
jgi:thiol-disulfide isomerase/thioredoxin